MIDTTDAEAKHNCTDAESKYKCIECNLQFGTPRDLSRHLNKTARHGGQPSPCAICHKPLTRPDSRARHERRCRDRFGVTEEMWRGIESERQRGRRKSISIEGVDNGPPFSAVPESTGEGPSMSSGVPHERRIGPSRSRTVSISSDAAELTTAFAHARVAPRSSVAASPSPRYVPQPGEPGSWTRARSSSLLAHPVPPPPTAGFSGRTRNPVASSPPSRNAFPQPPPTHAYRRSQNYRDSQPIDPLSSPRGIQDESDSESIAPMRGQYGTRMAPHSLPRWTTLGGEEEQEVDELAEYDDESWDSPARTHGHSHVQRMPDTTMAPPPKKKLLGFEPQGSGSPGWSSHMSRTPR
ncbi:hypothetical protein EI94DRAFT_1725849 [Lactarius quietus]|nr:hypothetical protein EI94DRAFT_1725849 [Lactarius quietus]